jgi:hypothetical protein
MKLKKEVDVYYIFINDLSLIMKKNISKIDGFIDFYEIYIPISKEFYLDFKSSLTKEIILSEEKDHKSIIDYKKYFKHSINLSFQSEINLENKNILLFKLDDIACF